MAKSGGDRAGRGGTCTKRHFLLSKHSLPPAHQQSSTPNPLRCPALLRWGPLSPSPREPPHPKGKGGGPREALGRSRSHTRPHPGPGRPCIVPGALRPPPLGSSSPAAPRRPRPAPPPPRSRYRGRLLARRGLQRKGRGVWTGGGDGRRRRGSREAEAGKGEVRQRRHFPRLPPTDERRAAHGSWSRSGAWGGRPGSGFEVWGRGPEYSRSAPAVKNPCARSLATDREPDVTEVKRQRPRPLEHVTGRGLAARPTPRPFPGP